MFRRFGRCEEPGKADELWTLIRYRWLQGMVIVSLTAVVVACTVFAPLYDGAIQQAALRMRMHDEPVQATGISVSSTGNSHTAPLATRTLLDLVPPRVRRYLRPAIASITVNMNGAARQGGYSPTGPMMWRQGMCGHLRYTSGRCPRRVLEVAVSAADARIFGWHVGSRVAMSERISDPTVHDSKGRPHPTVQVVGVYTVVPGRYWYGAAPVGRSGTLLDQGSRSTQVDAWLTTRGTVDGSVGGWAEPTNEVDLPLERSRVGIDDILRIGPVVDRFVATPDPSSDGEFFAAALTARSGLPDIARAAALARDQAQVTVPLLMAQLGLLAVVVLWLVLGAATEQRRSEVAVARLRGLGAGGARRLLLVELGTLILTGVPVGVLAALGLSWLTRHAFLPFSTPLELGAGFGVAVGAVVVVLAVATVASVQQVVSEPVSALLRRVPVRRIGWAVGVLDAMVVAGCTTAVVAFATGGLRGPIALAAPALLALLVGLVLSHLLVPVAGSAGRRLLDRGQAAAGVSALHVARRPTTRRVVAVVTVATGVLVFSADALAVGARNRELAAEQETGAPLVATVSRPDVSGVRAALREVDPLGHAVTPVVTLTPPDPSGTITRAVLPGQFSLIALLPGRSTGAVPWHRLAAPPVPALRLVGRTASVSVTSRVGGTTPSASEALALRMLLVDADGRERAVPLTTVADGVRSGHRVRVQIPCAAGCDLTGLRLDTNAEQPIEGSFTLSGLTTSSGQRLQVGPGGRWRGTRTPTAGTMRSTSADRGGLTVSFSGSGSEPLELTHASVPRRLPALVAGPLPPDSVGERFTGLGLDGVDRSMTRVARLRQVPAAPAHTAVVNLEVLQRDGAVPDPLTVVQVWFARDDPVLLARVTRALHARGMSVSGTSRTSRARRTLDQSVAAWSLALAALVGLAGLLLAVLVLVVMAATTWPARARDLAALRMSGLSRAQISRVATGEQVPIVALAVLAGGVCGVVGAHFAMPTVPLFASATQVSSADLGTAWAAALGAAGIALVLLCGTAWATARFLARRAILARVRESL